MFKRLLSTTLSMGLVGLLTTSAALAASNPLWTQQKVKNYLPHMTVAEVEDLLTRSDIVIIPIGALEQHANHLPIGTDFLNGVERAKLIAQERDVLVAPVLMAGQSPYHMGFAGTISLSAETIMRVHLEAVDSLIAHGFKRFIVLNAHGGNRAITTLLVDQINQTTPGVAVSLGAAIAPFLEPGAAAPSSELDRHAGVPETSNSLYLIPDLVQLDQAVPAELTLPAHLEAMLPEVVAGDPTALLLFLAEGLKAEETGKRTSSAEMTSTGVWGTRDPREATAVRGEDTARRTVRAAVRFIDRWNELSRSALRIGVSLRPCRAGVRARRPTALRRAPGSYALASTHRGPARNGFPGLLSSRPPARPAQGRLDACVPPAVSGRSVLPTARASAAAHRPAHAPGLPGTDRPAQRKRSQAMRAPRDYSTYPAMFFTCSSQPPLFRT